MDSDSGRSEVLAQIRPLAVKRSIVPFTPPSVSSADTLFAALSVIERLFDHVPDTVFFVKGLDGRYRLVNSSLVERCGKSAKTELIGRHVREIFPNELGGRYAAQDAAVLKNGRPIEERLELHWYPNRRTGWCLTTKLPLRTTDGTLVGLVGISRDLRAPGDGEIIPPSLTQVLDHLETNYGEPLSPASLAKLAGLSPVRFARLIKRIFRLTPSQLITQTRLAAASRMLEESEKAVAEVALACGFYDHSAFARAFKSATGATPRDFRLRASRSKPS